MSEDLNNKSANLVLKLSSESGYKCTQVEEISINQWKDINKVLRDELKSEELKCLCSSKILSNGDIQFSLCKKCRKEFNK